MRESSPEEPKRRTLIRFAATSALLTGAAVGNACDDCGGDAPPATSVSAPAEAPELEPPDNMAVQPVEPVINVRPMPTMNLGPVKQGTASGSVED